MSVRRPFTRGGRHLQVVRPRPFVPPPLAGQCTFLLISPAAGTAVALRAAARLPRVAWALAAAGLLRTVADGLWQGGLVALLARGDWEALLTVPGLLLTWLWSAAVLHLASSWLGGQARFAQALRLLGIALLAWPVAGFLNLVHMLLPLPAITWGMGRPMFGLGEVLLLPWLFAVARQAGRQAYGLSPARSLLAALLPTLGPVLLPLSLAGMALRFLPFLPGDWRPDIWFSFGR